jgi:starch synthase
MEILYAAAEMVPLAKVGGLADVAGSLTHELARLGHRVTVCLPYYPSVRAHAALGQPELIAELSVGFGSRTRPAGLYRARLPGSDVELWLFANDDYFDRPNPYVDPRTGRDWPDNAERFVFFSRAILEACRVMHRAPDVFHLNDYQVGLVAPFLREEGRGSPLARSAVLLSVHNLGYQGIFPIAAEVPAAGEPAVGAEPSAGAGFGAGGEPGPARESGQALEPAPTAEQLARELGFNAALARPFGALEFYGRLNFLKAGLVHADLITAVSPTYAREIQTPELGFGLEGILSERADRVIGILNGIDAEIWDPMRDALIPVNYGPADIRGKQENKARLLEAMHLPQHPRLPVIGMISRLVDQKGFDLLARAADDLFARGDFRMVVLGSGMPVYEQLCRDLARRYPQHFAVAIDFNDPLAHLIEAGADMFLMPSLYEPCGLNQMYSMRYGTVPIVRATGGLADTVAEFDAGTGRGSGFVFHAYEPGAMHSAIGRALSAHARSNIWKKLVVRDMERDFSWTQAARAYVGAYERAVNERARRLATG